MRNIIYNFIVIGMVSVLFTLPIIVVAAQDSNGLIYDKNTPGQVKIVTEKITLKITGHANVPQFFFWASGESEPSSSTTTTDTSQTGALYKGLDSSSTNDESDQGNGKNKLYFVKFLSVFEFEDGNDNGVYDGGEKKVKDSQITFPSKEWIFSEIKADKNGDTVTALHFNFTHNGTPSIRFQNHIRADQSNQLKFDVIINDYNWKDSNAKFALNIHLSGGTIEESGENRFKFGDAFFGYQSEAEGSSDTVNARANKEGNTIYLCYSHFGSSLNHDPEIGFEDSSLIGIDYLPVIVSLTIISGVIIHIRRKRQFD